MSIVTWTESGTDIQLCGKGQLGPCVICGLDLPLCLPSAHEAAGDWVCVRCGACYSGVLLNDAPRHWLKNIRRNEAVVPRTVLLGEQVTSQSFRSIVRPSGTERIALPSRTGVRSALQNGVSRELDLEIARPSNLQPKRQGTPFASNVRPHGIESYSQNTIQQFVAGYDEAAQKLAETMSKLSDGRGDTVCQMHDISLAALERAAEDIDLFVCLAVNPLHAETPGSHSLHTAMVAMAIATNLFWDQKNIVDLGIGCLLHDIGMQRVRKELFRDDRVLTESDFHEVAKHPIYTFEMLSKYINDVSLTSRLVAYQIHERLDGSGYPRGHRAHQIHELAKIAAVADVFVALVSPRPHRPGIIPYFAVEHLLRGVRDGLFDAKVVRALLKTTSLFPVGSFVTLSDGRVGKVIRTNGASFTQPILEVWERGNMKAAPRLTDLALEPNCRILAPLAELPTV